MLGLKQQVFGDKGYSADMCMTPFDLDVFRDLINEHWLRVIALNHPELSGEANRVGIENYHIIANKLDHQQLWPKQNRVLPQPSVEKIKALPFWMVLKKEFGDFSVSDVYDVRQHHGHEEVYWRLVRPNAASDVGPLHADKWFHHSFNMGYGMFSPDVATVKIWIPIFCEPGKNGLMLLEGSHLRDWNYHVETIDGLPRPKIDEDVAGLGAQLVHTEPGNMIIFNEKLLHGGAVNVGNTTRVSAEITMVISVNDVSNFQRISSRKI